MELSWPCDPRNDLTSSQWWQRSVLSLQQDSGGLPLDVLLCQSEWLLTPQHLNWRKHNPWFTLKNLSLHICDCYKFNSQFSACCPRIFLALHVCDSLSFPLLGHPWLSCPTKWTKQREKRINRKLKAKCFPERKGWNICKAQTLVPHLFMIHTQNHNQCHFCQD